jgi:hypothetical protein
MRLIVCLIPLLYGCSTSIVRCDARLQPINRPAASGAATAAPGISSASPEPTPARRVP